MRPSGTLTAKSRTGDVSSATSTSCEVSPLSEACCSRRLLLSATATTIVLSSFQEKLRIFRSSLVRSQGSPPRASSSQSCVGARVSSSSASLPAGAWRVLRKAMVDPSGDHRGPVLRFRPRVSTTSSRCPPIRLSMRFETLSPFSLSITVFTQTAWRPSGETWKSPAFSASRMSSMVQASPGTSAATGVSVVPSRVRAAPRANAGTNSVKREGKQRMITSHKRRSIPPLPIEVPGPGRRRGEE